MIPSYLLPTCSSKAERISRGSERPPGKNPPAWRQRRNNPSRSPRWSDGFHLLEPAEAGTETGGEHQKRVIGGFRSHCLRHRISNREVRWQRRTPGLQEVEDFPARACQATPSRAAARGSEGSLARSPPMIPVRRSPDPPLAREALPPRQCTHPSCANTWVCGPFSTRTLLDSSTYFSGRRPSARRSNSPAWGVSTKRSGEQTSASSSARRASASSTAGPEK